MTDPKPSRGWQHQEASRTSTAHRPYSDRHTPHLIGAKGSSSISEDLGVNLVSFLLSQANYLRCTGLFYGLVTRSQGRQNMYLLLVVIANYLEPEKAYHMVSFFWLLHLMFLLFCTFISLCCSCLCCRCLRRCFCWFLEMRHFRGRLGKISVSVCNSLEERTP